MKRKSAKKSTKRTTKKVSRKKLTKKRTKTRIKRNPGGGWEFEGKFANKWAGIRAIPLREEVIQKVELFDKNGKEWLPAEVIVERHYDENAGKFTGKVNVIRLLPFSSIFVSPKPTFLGVGNGRWKDWRIGQKSGGMELLNSDDGRWYSVNATVNKDKDVITVHDLRYDVA